MVHNVWESVWSIIVIALTDSNYSDTYINDNAAKVWFCSTRKVNSDPLNSNTVKDQFKYVTSQISNCRCISRIIVVNQGIPCWDSWLKLMLSLRPSLSFSISKNNFVSCTKQDKPNKKQTLNDAKIISLIKQARSIVFWKWRGADSSKISCKAKKRGKFVNQS